MADNYQSKGISFPFRIGVRGGVTMSVADYTTPQKIVESYQQILGTGQHERCMENQIFSQINALVFDVADDSMTAILEYVVKDALNSIEKRANVNDVIVGKYENMVIVVLNFTVLNTGKTYNTTIELPEGS